MADGVSRTETSVIGSGPAGDVLCVGHAFTANVGDQAIFEVIRDRFASRTGLEVHAFPIKPVSVNRLGHTLTLPRKLLLGLVALPAHYAHLFRRARAHRAVIIGVGNAMHDMQPFAAVQFLLACLVVRTAARPLWIFGGGAGPLRTFLGRWCVGAACRLARSVTVRDSYSASELQKCPGAASRLRDELVPDVVLTVTRRDPPRPRADRLRVSISTGHYMAPRRYPGGEPAAYARFLDRMERLIRLVVNRLHADVVLFTNEPNEDGDTIRLLLGRLGDLSQVRTAEAASFSEALRLAGSFDLHIGARLHSVIFSLTQHVPATVVSGQAKAVGLYADLDAGDLLHDVGSFEPDAVVDSLERLQGDRGELLLRRVDELRARATKGLDRLIDEVYRYVENTRSPFQSAVEERASTLTGIERS